MQKMLKIWYKIVFEYYYPPYAATCEISQLSRDTVLPHYLSGKRKWNSVFFITIIFLGVVQGLGIFRTRAWVKTMPEIKKITYIVV